MSPTDPYYCTECGYLVYVKGTQFSIDHSAAFTMVFSLETPIIRLQYDITYSGLISKDRNKHYSLPLATDDDKEVSLSVIPLAGEMQLYISISNSEMRPDESNYFISSAVFDTSQFLITRKHVLQFCSSGEAQCNCYISVISQLPAACSVNATQKAVPSVPFHCNNVLIVLALAAVLFIYSWKYRPTDLSHTTGAQDTSKSTTARNTVRPESMEISEQAGRYQPMEPF